MKDIVSFETAKRLKEAGFPQPEEFSVGDWWWAMIVRDEHSEFSYPYNERFFLRACVEKGRLEVVVQTNGCGVSLEEDYCYFAPTATDILVRLPDLTALYKWRHENVWCVDYQTQDPPLLTGTPHRHKNPAEACAEAWLKLNKK